MLYGLRLSATRMSVSWTAGLVLHVGAILEANEPVVIHCAGRTRSIIGTATLQKLRIDNVYELRNGMMG